MLGRVWLPVGHSAGFTYISEDPVCLERLLTVRIGGNNAFSQTLQIVSVKR